MLRNIVYLGHMAQGKTTKVSFKSNVTVSNPKENWYVVENTHEPIVTAELFNMASRRSRQRTCKKKSGFTNVFSGIAKCADCGKSMSTVGTRKKGAQANLACGAYKLHGSKECSNHFIDYDILYNLVLKTIQNVIKLSKNDEENILKTASERVKKEKNKNSMQEETASLKKRKHELDLLIEKIYEDHIKDLLSTERMRSMVQKYEGESKMIDDRLAEIEGQSKNKVDDNPLQKLRTLLQGYTEITALTPELLYRLIDRIEVSQGAFVKTERGRVKQQTVKIFFRFSRMPVTETYEV